jgi:predicted 3-demethylubiquinone-9 3-methyltransferase (glyoxalase superfamily)
LITVPKKQLNFTPLFSKTHSKIMDLARYGEAGAKVSGQPKGMIMTVTFSLNGQDFMAMESGGREHPFTFTPAISFLVNCQTQEEIDELWEKLSEGGEKEQCGWLKDKFGVT